MLVMNEDDDDTDDKVIDVNNDEDRKDSGPSPCVL